MIRDSVRESIFVMIEAERARQDCLHAGSNVLASPNDWVAFIAEEVGEAAKPLNTMRWGKGNAETTHEALMELIQVAALAVAAIERLGLVFEAPRSGVEDDSPESC